jgi:DNA polymerase-3 subunit epsilon
MQMTNQASLEMSLDFSKPTPKEKAEYWLHNGCLVLDAETTGLDENAEIIELAVIDELGNTLLNTLVKPTKPIPAEAIEIHGITNEMVADAPSWETVRGQLAWIMVKNPRSPLVIYNADYDSRLIVQTEVANGGDYFNPALLGAECAMLAYAEFYGDWNEYREQFRWQKLVNAADQQCVEVKGAHRALSDCLMTLGVIQAMAGAFL